jgi:hypothetical protein
VRRYTTPTVIVCYLLSACISQATAGKVLTGTGGVLALVGVLDYAGAFGGDCREDASGQTSCPASGQSDKASAVGAIALGAAVAATGVTLWALSGTSAEPRRSSPVLQTPQRAAEPVDASLDDPATGRYLLQRSEALLHSRENDAGLENDPP